jgi:hypothetical protein
MTPAPPTNRRGGATGRFALRLLAGLGVLAFVLRQGDWGDLRVGGWRVVLSLGLGGLLLVVSQALAALRWRTILSSGALPWSFLARLYLIAGFFSLMLPTAVGGDAVRASAAIGVDGRPGRIVASVILDRCFGVAALMVYALLGLAIAGGLPPLLRPQLGGGWGLTGLAALAALCIGSLVVIRRSAYARELIGDGVAELRALLGRPRDATMALGLGLAVQALVIAIWVVAARGLGLVLPLSTFLVAVPLVTLGTMLPITLGGLGVREAIWLILLGGSGVSRSQLVAMSLGYFGASVVSGLVGLALFLTLGLRRADDA